MMNKGTFFFPVGGEINWGLFAEANEKIPEAAMTGKLKHLIVTVGSPGGDPDAAWSINCLLSSLTCKVTTVAIGRVFSAGIIIFLAGQQRIGLRDSLFLFHPTTISVTENESRARYKIEEELKGFEYDDNLYKIMLQGALLDATKADIEELCHPTKSTFVDAEKALKMGLLTKVVQNIKEI